MKKELQNLSIHSLEVIDDEPRIKDVILGERLGLKKARDVRVVIKSNIAELLKYGGTPLVTANEKLGCLTRMTEAYYLNEAQALLICMFSRTAKAAEVRKELIDVYMAYRTKGLVKVKEHYRNSVKQTEEAPQQKSEKDEMMEDADAFFIFIKLACKEAVREELALDKKYPAQDWRLTAHHAIDELCCQMRKMKEQQNEAVKLLK
ncbi:MAG: hypothetical protein PHE89_02630 [Alphaproteobacteria bacterium]|nr:hypothetical protein [Alphaproteobacteria bacterium]